MVQLAHYKAVNLARRFTQQNENDTLGFIGYEDDIETPQVEYNKDVCANLAKHMLHVSNLPNECMKYKDVVATVQANDKDMTHPTSWMS